MLQFWATVTQYIVQKFKLRFTYPAVVQLYSQCRTRKICHLLSCISLKPTQGQNLNKNVVKNFCLLFHKIRFLIIFLNKKVNITLSKTIAEQEPTISILYNFTYYCGIIFICMGQLFGQPKSSTFVLTLFGWQRN